MGRLTKRQEFMILIGGIGGFIVLIQFMQYMRERQAYNAQVKAVTPPKCW